MYKYSLDTSSKKFICLQCNKKSFVRYRDNETGNYLNSSIGRCDRERKCGYHSKPNGNKTLVNIEELNIVAEPSYHNNNVLCEYGNNYCCNNFITILRQYFINDDILIAINKYFIGTSNHWKGATIFWQVDQDMNVAAGKVMLYDPETGKRVKKPYTHINWMHRILPENNFVLQQCLFGIHNLIDYEHGSTVCIVESEKTAIIMSIMYPDFLWLATGSKSNLKETLLRPLKPYNVIVYPDNKEYTDWNNKVLEMQGLGYTIVTSKLLESDDFKNGCDLVDIALL